MHSKFESFVKYNPSVKDQVTELYNYIENMIKDPEDKQMLFNAICAILDQRVKIIYKYNSSINTNNTDASVNTANNTFATVTNTGSINTNRSKETSELTDKHHTDVLSHINNKNLIDCPKTKLEGQQQQIVKEVRQRRQEAKEYVLIAAKCEDFENKKENPLEVNEVISKVLKYGTYEQCAEVLSGIIDYKISCYHLKHLIENNKKD